MKIKLAVLSLVCLLLFPLQTLAAELPGQKVGPPDQQPALTVAVAANVQFAFDEINTVFQRETGIFVKPVIGSSGKFVSQIENGAPFDVFLSADMEYPQALSNEGLTINAPRVYALGHLVLWTLRDDVDLSKGITLLAESQIKKIAIASPKTAPYGRQAVNALKNYNIYTHVEKKLVYGESIAQTNQFIAAKAVDVGITAKSIVLASNMKDQGKWADIEKTAYEPIAQGAVILKHAEKENLKDAMALFDFLFSPQASEIFQRYGYELP